MERIKKYAIKTLAVVFGLCFGIIAGHAQDATDILAKAETAYKNTNGFTATFSTANYNQNNLMESFEGTIHARGNKFHVQTPEMQVWFNGSTQWVYQDHSEEVNVNTPSEEELQLFNPVYLLGNYQQRFSASYKREVNAANGKPAYVVELTPKRTEDITTIELQIEKSSNLPVQITVNTRNGYKSIIQLNNIKTGLNQPDTIFTFNKVNFPDVEVIDLR